MRSDHLDVVFSKFDKPILPLDHVPRPQLVSRLARMANQRVTVVSAPMGYGKTCLLAELAESVTGALWLSLDKEDGDPTRLWSHVAALLGVNLDTNPCQKECSSALRDWRSAEKRLSSAYDSPNDVSCRNSSAADGTLIFVDRFECICDTPSAEEFVAFAESLPPAFHLVVATRCVPERFAQRLSALGNFSLSGYDLEFSEAESAELMSRAAEIAGTRWDEEIEKEALHATEGWPQGVSMAAKSLFDHARGSYDFRFGGSNVYVDSYFRENVERLLDEDRLSWLVSLSAFERFNDGLIDYAFGQSGSDVRIRAMIDLGIPLVRCDTSGSWFRFGGLFADWLRQQLVGKRISELCLMASVWFDGRKRTAEAAKYMLMAVDYEYVENLVEAIYGLRRRNRRTPFVLWLSRQSSAELTEVPLMCALYAWSYNSAGYIEQSRDWGRRFERLLSGGEGDNTPRPGFLEFGLRVFTSKLDAMEGKCRAALQASEPILAVGERIKPVVLSVTYQSRGEAYARMGVFENAADEFIKARASAKAGGALHQVYFNLYSYADSRYRLADLDSAVSSCDRLIAECPSEYPFVGASHALRSRILLERNDLVSAQKDVEAALSITTPYRNLDLYMESLMAKAYYEATLGDVAIAYETAYSAVILGEQRPAPRDVLIRAYVVQALIAFELESEQELEVIAARIGACLAEDDEYGMLMCGYINGLLFQKQGNMLRALEELDQVFTETMRRGHKDLAIKVCAARVAVLDSVGNVSRRRSATRDLVMLAMKPGYIASLLVPGEPMRRALRDLLSSQGFNAGVRGYIKQVLAAFDSYLDRHHARRAADVRGLEELTAREREVLELLNRGMSRKEIAETLCISVNTAKHHVTHIYEKLGVSSKREALDRVSL
ncbi:MAG TPA: hypothetical protein IAC28_03915 [Candidatus Aphodovivens excrementavium]|nr:hypothetical protein [Candidatus Aphodovivens excrementavium]